MSIKSLIYKRKREFDQICAEHKVEYLYVFGSSLSNNYDPQKSDVDLLVELKCKDPIERGETLLSLWDKLEHFFQNKVDLLTDSSTTNPYLRKSIDATKVLIYDGSGKKVLI